MVNIHIVSGFLGSGKTTFIKKYLNLLKDEKTVILENEFGEVGIDGDLVRDKGYEVVELPSGCICCTLKLNFYDSLVEIIENINPKNIVIEPTGLGLLSEILNILEMRPFKESCKIKALNTIIDGESYLEQEEIFGEFFKDQIINAKNIFISKVDLIDEDILNSIISSLRKINKNAYIIYENLGNIDSKSLGKLLKGEEFFTINTFKDKAKNEIKDFMSIGFNTDRVFTNNELENKLKALCNGNFGNVIRAKGILKGKNKTLEFNYVNGKYIITNSNLDNIYKVCIIGRNLKKERIEVLFKQKRINFSDNIKKVKLRN